MLPQLRAALILLALGGTVGPLLDALHTHTGATAYARPQWLSSVWWCPPLFAAAGLAVGLTRPLVERALRRADPLPTPSRFALAQLLFVAAYAGSGLLPFGSGGKTAALGLLFAVTWLLADRTLSGLVSAGLVAFGGWAVEATLVAAGLFSHRDRELLGVALWIPLLYATAAIAIGHVGKRLLPPTPPPQETISHLSR